jgi:hypothetical protein
LTTETVAISFELSKNWTLPPIELGPGGVIVAVKMVGLPIVAGFSLLATLTTVGSGGGACPTFTVSAGEVPARYVELPANVAVMTWLPVVRVDMERTATPELRVLVPMTLPPSWKVTVPVAEAGVTPALKTTDWPAVGLIVEAVRLTDVDVWPTVTGCVPVELPSDTVIDWEPAVFNVALNVCTPPSPGTNV